MATFELSTTRILVALETGRLDLNNPGQPVDIENVRITPDLYNRIESEFRITPVRGDIKYPTQLDISKLKDAFGATLDQIIELKGNRKTAEKIPEGTLNTLYTDATQLNAKISAHEDKFRTVSAAFLSHDNERQKLKQSNQGNMSSESSEQALKQLPTIKALLDEQKTLLAEVNALHERAEKVALMAGEKLAPLPKHDDTYSTPTPE